MGLIILIRLITLISFGCAKGSRRKAVPAIGSPAARRGVYRPTPSLRPPDGGRGYLQRGPDRRPAAEFRRGSFLHGASPVATNSDNRLSAAAFILPRPRLHRGAALQSIKPLIKRKSPLGGRQNIGTFGGPQARERVFSRAFPLIMSRIAATESTACAPIAADAAPSWWGALIHTLSGLSALRTCLCSNARDAGFFAL